MRGRIYLGSAYYPEMWSEDEIEKDIERCRQLGVNTLRVGEFAWGKMEPREGEFCFGWLKNVVDRLYAAGIYTVMCTPTATPPRWLLKKYPETRMVMHDLIRADVSSRCHTCKTSPVMREKNRVIVTKMAEVFAGHPGIVGWQIDNEIYPYSEGCYCEKCRAAFRSFLKEKFGSVDALNEAWGMTRWSLTYDSFDDVDPPYPRQWRHPSLRKAWHDFQCAQIKSYVEEQADILHRFGCGNVGTDMMAQNYLSYYAVNEKLDVVQFNHYNPAQDLPNTAFSYDFLRCVKDRPFWVAETQVGWNGSNFADCGYRPVGNCYANTWLPVARGAEMNLYWLFRTHPNGHEMAHGALFSPAGRAYRVSEEVRRAAEDFSVCGDFLAGTKIVSRIALHYSATAMNGFESAPLLKGMDYRRFVLEYFYAAFRHYNVDVIDTPHGLSGYHVLTLQRSTKTTSKRASWRGWRAAERGSWGPCPTSWTATCAAIRTRRTAFWRSLRAFIRSTRSPLRTMCSKRSGGTERRAESACATTLTSAKRGRRALRTIRRASSPGFPPLPNAKSERGRSSFWAASSRMRICGG